MDYNNVFKIKVQLTFSALVFSFCCSFSLFAQQRFEKNPQLEVIAMFQENILRFPEGKNSSPLNELEIAKTDIKDAFLQVNAKDIRMAFPEFKDLKRKRVNRTGEQIELIDMSKIVIIRLQSESEVESLIEKLSGLPGVVYAEANAIEASQNTTTPNDTHFGDQWALDNDGSGGGTTDADIDATEAWDISTGQQRQVKVAVIDNGIQSDHEDLPSTVGDVGTNLSGIIGHGTQMAGIIAAIGNNSTGIAGINWNVKLHNEKVDYGIPGSGEFAAAVNSAINANAEVINASWKTTDNWTIAIAFANAYKLNVITAASMGAAGTSTPQVPAALGRGIIAVGATDKSDVIVTGTNTGPHIDVVAPGFAIKTTQFYNPSTPPSGRYTSASNTSPATAHVSGIASLLLAVNGNLYNDDVENIIKASAEKKAWMTNVNVYGQGRVNAKKALDRIRSPYTLTHVTATGGTDYSTSGSYTMTIVGVPGLSTNNYIVKRHEVRKTVTYSAKNDVAVWGRGLASTGWTASSPNYGLTYSTVVGTPTATTAVLKTYVYEVWTTGGSWVGWHPTTPSNVVFGYTVNGIPAPTPPPTPQNLTISNAGQIGQNPNLTWNASSGATSYDVYRWNGSSWENWTNVTGTSYTDVSITISSSSDPDAIEIKYYVKAVNAAGSSGASNQVSTWGEGFFKGLLNDLLPDDFGLGQNYPNPFNPVTEIKYQLPKAANVSLKVYSVTGQEVATLVNGNVAAGFHSVKFDASSLASGTYIYRIVAGSFTDVKRMVVIK